MSSYGRGKYGLRCPESIQHTHFTTTVHVAQTWITDRAGESVGSTGMCEETIHHDFPGDDGALYQCLECGADAVAKNVSDVVIEVRGGVAEVVEKPENVVVEIVDHDDLDARSDPVVRVHERGYYTGKI